MRQQHHWHTAGLIALAVLAGCGGDPVGGQDPDATSDAGPGPDGSPDGAVSPDGGPGPDGSPDGAVGPDGGPGPDGAVTEAPVGAPCTAETDCAGNYCITDAQAWPDGYCTQYGCDPAEAAWETSCAPHGGDALCLDSGGYGMCFDRCDPATPDCRTGYECLDLGGPGICLPIPICGNGVVERGEECDPPGATCTASCQGTGTAPIGDPCVDATECAGSYCLIDAQGYPDGYCSDFTCDPADPAWLTSCAPYGGDALCLDVGGYGMCLDQCDRATPDCRTGYECLDLGDGHGACYPVPVCGNGLVERGEECDPPDDGITCTAACQGTGTAPVGDPCTAETDCAGNYCFLPADGFVDGYCTQYGCDPSDPAWLTSCAPYGGAALCLDLGGYGWCLDACYPTAPDCRAGYECLDLGTGQGVCYPEPVCGNGIVERGEECDPPDGGVTCTATCQGMGTAPVGDPCTSETECAGTYCLTDAQGFPDGYCSDFTCDPADPAWLTSCAPHGGDALCLDVGGYGMCLDQCDLATPDCRTDYECLDLGDGHGVCYPVPVCGNGVVERGEECDPPGATCTASCQGTGTAPIGDPCTSAMDCEGNGCLTDADGFPLGYCAFAGCDLADANACAGLATDPICVNFGTPADPYGVCVDGCTPGPNSCRTGYSCTMIGIGTRACLPQ